jgi:2,4-diaminopentanoate dehydrogenase
MENIKVVIWGYGAMGKGIADMLLNKKGVEIVGVCDLNTNYVGKDFKTFLDVEYSHKPVIISNDMDFIINNNKIDIAILATDSFTNKAFPKIKKIVEAGINVISTAEEMAYPYASEAELSKEMNELAIKNNVTILGTGINPGFVMDLLVIALTGVMSDVQHIEARRVNSLSPFGPTVMEEQGVGITQKEFQDHSADNSLAGHVGFKESVYMIADAIGIKLDKFEQQMKPIVSSVYRKSKYAEVKPNNLAGIDMTAQGYVGNSVFIDMKHPQQIEPELEGTHTGDYVTIKGNPNVNLSINPEIDGGIGTIAMCVNMIPQVINSAPGLKTMIDLPIPRAILGDMRDLIIR